MNRILSWGLIPLCLIASISLFGQAGNYYFSASSGTFTPINGSDTVSEIHVDTKLSSAKIPMGFNFVFDGVTYTKLKASSNGFLQLDTTKTSSRTTNELNNVNEPIIAPLWDDHDGSAAGTLKSNASYVTTGTAPNRVFTMEWLNWEWRYNADSAVISFQVKLYETSNKIEFIYRGESAAVKSGSASIGICGLGTGVGTFISLSDFGTSPTASHTLETISISTKPASGQTYTFTPATCKMPISFKDTLTTTTTNTVKFVLNSTGSQYDYQYDTTGFTLGTGSIISTSSPIATLSGLSASTTYDIYVRTICSPGDTSKWAKHTFVTACGAFTATSNYSENFDSYPNSVVPTCWTAVLKNLTSGYDRSATSTTNKSTPRGYELYNSSSTTGDLGVVTPEFGDLTSKLNRIQFDVRVSSSAAPTNLIIGTVSHPDSIGTFVPFDTVLAANLTTSWLSVEVKFDTKYTQTHKYIYFKHDLGSTYDYIYIDNFSYSAVPNLDLSAESVYRKGTCLTSSDTVVAVIKNKTTATLNFATNNATVGVSVSGASTGSTSVMLTTDTLAAGDTLHVAVGALNLSAVGTHSLKSFAIVSGDGDNTNDTSAVLAAVQGVTATLPQKVNFTGFTGSNLSTVYPGWTEASGKPASGTTSDWEESTSSQQTAFGKTGAKVNIYGTGQHEWMFSPKFSVSSTDTLLFKGAVTDWNDTDADAMGADDSMNVLISTDCGTTWTRIYSINTSNEPGNAYVSYKVPLSSYSGNTAILAFFGTSGTSTGQDYDFHVTDIFIGTPPSNDLGVTAITEPTGGCGDDSTKVKVAVFNYGSAIQSSIGVTVNVTGTSTTTLSTTISSLAAGKADTVVVGTLNTLAGGTYSFNGYTTHAGDQDNSNDTTSLDSIKIGAIPTSASISSFTVCAGTDSMLVASGSTSNYRWFKSTKPDSAIFVGDTLVLNGLSSTATYQVEGFNSASEKVGETTTPASGFITTSLYGVGFDVNVPEVVIDTVTMYPSGTGWFIVNITNYAGVVQSSSDTIKVTSASLTKTKVPVNLNVSAGKYKMTMTYSGITTMGREFGKTFPFNSPSGAVSIIGGSTGTGNPTSTSYYWFYDWSITIPACPSARTSATVTVNPLPVFSLGKDTAFCGGSGFSYTLDATTTGATYKWNDNSTNATLTATTAGTYYCAVTLNGCIVSDTAKVGANALPTVNFPNPTNICSNDTATNLSGGTPTGGVYSGTNVSAGQFSPASAGAGQDTLYYTYTDTIGCKATDTAYIVVDAAPNVTWSSLTDVCIGAAPVNLSGAMPIGGTYSGPGVNTSGIFNSDTAGVGSHNLKYSFTDSKGCTDTTIQAQVVNALPTVSFSTQNNWCLNASPLKLSGGMPTGGTYTVNGVADTTYSSTKAGMDTIIYMYTDTNSCSNTDTALITADTVPVVTFSTLADLCVGSASYTLVEGAPIGGVYSGNSVSGGKYNPSSVAMDTLTYAFTDSNKCTAMATQSITVNALPVVAISSQSAVCENTPSFALSGGTPTGGAYSGGGVSGGNYDASSFGTGSDMITYVYSDGNNCKDSATTTLVVNAVSKATLKFLGYSCDNSPALSLVSSGLPAGGVFSGTGVTGTDFDSKTAGTGTHNISYVYTNSNSCQDSAKQDIIVEASPVFNIIGDSTGCGNGSDAPVLKVNLAGMTYHWSSGSNTDTAVVMQNGPAWVKVTDPSTQKLCFNYDTVNVTYEAICVGIKENLAGTSVNYYPNPSNGTFNYNIQGFNGVDINVTIITANGQEVYRDVWNNVSDKSGEIQLNVMESGLYFINLSTSNGSVMHRLEIMR